MSGISAPAGAEASLSVPVIPIFPAGLEHVYDAERQNLRTAMHSFVLSVHWAIIRAGLRLRSTDQQFTERLPQGWPSLVDQVAEGKLILNYIDPNTNNTYEFKIVEVSPNDTVVVTVFRRPSEPQPASAQASSSSSSSPEKTQTTSASTFRIASYVNMESFQSQGQAPTPRSASTSATFTNSNELEKKVWTELFEPVGLHVLGQPPVLGPYEDKTKKEKKKQEQPERVDLDYDETYYPDLEPRPSPLRPVPVQPGGIGIGGGPLDPFAGGLGRSDLDPLGRFGAGMTADPRGFRNPIGGPPMGIGRGQLPPGARFDPFGPVPPGRGGNRPRPGNFGQPNPDNEQLPPGFDDMFM